MTSEEHFNASDLLRDLSSLMRGLASPGQIIDRTEVGELVVSTVGVPDIHPLVGETAILDANGAHPVERYSSVEEALEGHLRWVELIPTLTTVTKLGYGVIQSDQEITLDRGEWK